MKNLLLLIFLSPLFLNSQFNLFNSSEISKRRIFKKRLSTKKAQGFVSGKLFDGCWDSSFSYNYIDLEENLLEKTLTVKITSSSEDFRKSIQVAYPNLLLNNFFPLNWRNAELEFTIEQSNKCRRSNTGSNVDQRIIYCSSIGIASPLKNGISIHRSNYGTSNAPSERILLVEDKSVNVTLSITKVISAPIFNVEKAKNINSYSVKLDLVKPSGEKLYTFDLDFPLDDKGNCLK